MNILIVGGNGTIGRAVAQRCVEEKHNVFVVDINEPLDDETIGTFAGTTLADSKKLIISGQVNRVIHLAETSEFTSINTAIHYRDLMELVDITNICAIHSVRIIVGCWMNRITSPTIFSYSTLNKMYICNSILNKGNLVITPVNIPRILDGNLPASNICAVLNRFLYAVQYGNLFVMQDCEYVTPKLIWCRINTIVDLLVSLLDRTTREYINPSIHECEYNTIDRILETAMQIYGIKEMDIILQKHEPVRLTSGAMVNDRTRTWVEQTITEYETLFG